jgi:hypothetical protein
MMQQRVRAEGRSAHSQEARGVLWQGNIECEDAVLLDPGAFRTILMTRGPGA